MKLKFWLWRSSFPLLPAKQHLAEHCSAYLILSGINAADPAGIGVCTFIDLSNVGSRGIGAAAEDGIWAVCFRQPKMSHVIVTWQINAGENSVTS